MGTLVPPIAPHPHGHPDALNFCPYHGHPSTPHLSPPLWAPWYFPVSPHTHGYPGSLLMPTSAPFLPISRSSG